MQSDADYYASRYPNGSGRDDVQYLGARAKASPRQLRDLPTQGADAAVETVGTDSNATVRVAGFDDPRSTRPRTGDVDGGAVLDKDEDEDHKPDEPKNPKGVRQPWHEIDDDDDDDNL